MLRILAFLFKKLRKSLLPHCQPAWRTSRQADNEVVAVLLKTNQSF
jgi:hypothetical protein